MMKINFRVLIGSVLLLFGGLLFIEQLGFLKGASSLFWNIIFLGVSAAFFYAFAQDMRNRWWAVIPGFVFLGIGADAFLPVQYEEISGAIFLGSLALAFFAVYLTDQSRWWGIIPGGVLATLAVLSVTSDLQALSDVANGSIFFIGLGITFLLVALLPNPVTRMNWAYIPAVVLVLLGVFLGNTEVLGMTSYLLPAALVLLGLGLVVGFFLQKD